MTKSETLTLIIKAKDAAGKVVEGLNTKVKQGRKALAAFNKEANFGQRAVSGLKGQVAGLVGAYVGFSALSRATRIIKEADQAAFSMQTSVAAANREFGNIGSVENWEQTVRRLSDELRIYSDSALKGAISRTVDMTKRLGLSKEQMEEVIKRSADLGAGKVELEGAIERVTAALRGEAESAEFLGLTLNENYVKAWYEANKATEKAWKDLTDLEKAQIRYQVMLEQTNEFQGRAAKSAETFGGVLQEINKEITNAIANNRDVTKAMNEVALTLKANSKDIGDLISMIVTAAARVVEFAVKWKKLILVLLGTGVAVKAVTSLVGVIKGLNAAFMVMTGMNLIPWLGKLRTALIAASAQSITLSSALGKAGLIGVVTGTAISVGLAVKAFYEWRQAAKVAREAQDRLRENADRLMRKYDEFKDVKLPDDMTKLAREDLEKFRKDLAKARAYYMALKGKLEERAEEKTFFGTATEDAREARKELGTVNAKLKEIQEDFKRVGEAAGESSEEMKKPAQAVMSTKEQLEEFEKQAKAAYENARKEAKKYAEEVISWEEKIKYARLSTEDKIRELGRKGLSEEKVWADKKKEAEEKLYSAKEAMRKKDYELAEKLAKDAEGLYADLAQEVKKTGDGKDVIVKSLEETKQIAIAGVTEVGNFVEQLYTEQKTAAEKARDEWTVTATGIQQQLTEIAKEREANVKIELKGLEAAQSAINQLLKPGTKHITVVTHHVEAKQAGGFAGGGRLAGYGGGDRIRALLEAGEFVIRKEAVRKYGAALFHALNTMRLSAPDLSGMVKARLGGLISNISIPAPRLAFQAGGSVPSVSSSGEAMTIRFQAGNVEMPLTVQGSRSVTRTMVKEFERELIKMGLTRK